MGRRDIVDIPRDSRFSLHHQCTSKRLKALAKNSSTRGRQALSSARLTTVLIGIPHTLGLASILSENVAFQKAHLFPLIHIAGEEAQVRQALSRALKQHNAPLAK